MGTIVCAACGHENDEAMRFCGECGEKIEQPSNACPDCGFENKPGTRFCSNCGKALGAATTLKLDKESYMSGAEMSLSVSGITVMMQNERAFVAVYVAGAGHSDWGVYQYPGLGNSTMTFEAPFDGGDYEMRLYRRDGQYDDTTFVTKAVFKVEEEAVDYDAVTLDLNNELYELGSQINVTIKNVPERMSRDRAFVSIYKAGAAHDAWEDYRSVYTGENDLVFDVPKGGSYEMRLYCRDGQYDDSTMLKSVAFVVGGTLQCPACGYFNQEGTKFCNECGTKLEATQNCPACGATIPGDLKFCGACGTRL
ncbi:MAG: zinc ribbon domain-containing protein [Coriobacteriia bacterium]|nr:zinc ribbon domain-containing protein [Coriobacteriia bacterium]